MPAKRRAGSGRTSSGATAKKGTKTRVVGATGNISKKKTASEATGGKKSGARKAADGRSKG